MNGEEQLLMNDTHKTRDEVDTEHEYQNFVPLADNGKKRILGDKNPWRHKHGKIPFSNKQLTKMFDAKIQLDLYMNDVLFA